MKTATTRAKNAEIRERKLILSGDRTGADAARAEALKHSGRARAASAEITRIQSEMLAASMPKTVEEKKAPATSAERSAKSRAKKKVDAIYLTPSGRKKPRKGAVLAEVKRQKQRRSDIREINGWFSDDGMKMWTNARREKNLIDLENAGLLAYGKDGDRTLEQAQKAFIRSARAAANYEKGRPQREANARAKKAAAEKAAAEKAAAKKA